MFEAAPCQMVHGLIRRADATTLCPRRLEWQHHCANDSQCMECIINFIDLADLHEMYLAACLGRHIAAKLPFKSGRRRIVMTQQYGNIEFDDIDVIKMEDYRYGMSQEIGSSLVSFKIMDFIYKENEIRNLPQLQKEIGSSLVSKKKWTFSY